MFSKKEGGGAGDQKPRLAGLFQLLKQLKISFSAFLPSFADCWLRFKGTLQEWYPNKCFLAMVFSIAAIKYALSYPLMPL